MDKCESYKSRIVGMIHAQANKTIYTLPSVGTWDKTQFQFMYDSIVANYSKQYTFETCDKKKFLKEVIKGFFLNNPYSCFSNFCLKTKSWGKMAAFR